MRGPWHNISRTETCWNWTGPMQKGGYGKHGGSPAHRVVYELLVGPIPEGLHIDHLCRNRACVRPEHLEPVTREENVRRGIEARTTCHKGHPWTEASTHWFQVGEWTRRRCRICMTERGREKRARAKARAEVGRA
jgi:hypothetical protein